MHARFARTPLCAAMTTALATAYAPAFAADNATLTLNPVVVTGSRAEAASFDLPAAIDVLNREEITSGQPRVNASEALIAVPGVVANNRQNYAQDLQISTRGFGARSAFGVRGIKLIADGIPASMPDGQGQAATFNLDVAERMEVLRGPYSAIYGNHSGGVIQLFTIEPRDNASLEAGFAAGSYGTTKADITAQGKLDGLGYVLNTSRFSTDGYREHSAATREQAFAKITGKPDEDSKLTFTINGLWQHNTQDPLGLSWAAYKSNPRGVDSAANDFNTRKSIDHLQGGVAYERRFGRDQLQLSAYSGQRSVIQYQAIPISAQANPRHSGGIIDFDRNFYGFGARYIAVREAAGGKLTTTFGIDYDNSTDQRTGYENFVGTTLGVKGKLRRNETDSVESLDPYVQTEWARGDWAVTVGLRHSQVKFKVDDKYIVGVNGNDSGGRDYDKTTPILGVVYKLNPAVNLYASAAKGFETPTLNEMFYSGSAAGFNFGLGAARSQHYEIGAKALIGDSSRLNVAAFQINTEDELVVDASTGGRTSYKNAGKTLRQGIEVSFDTDWRRDLTSRLALSHLRAIYDESFTTGTGASLKTIADGKSIPGIPRSTVFGDLAWKITPAITTAVEGVYRSKVYVEDSNTATPAPSYAIANIRVTAEQRLGHWRISEFARLDNLFDRNYVGSVVVGDTNSRYYESAPGRNGLVGVNARYTW
ncbi:TonB-dependent receptor family protein [Zoogloea sp.]|uniref:TonB-dependent receptor family protein n=1 Tax=Zoogloea sp. TaxID=49181 RepID=UPI0035B0437B